MQLSEIQYDRYPITEEEAITRAKALVEFLRERVGGEWQYEINEYSGWSYDVFVGTIWVSEGWNYEKSEVIFECHIGEGMGDDLDRLCICQIWEGGDAIFESADPVKAINMAIEAMANAVKKLNRVVSYNLSEIGRPVPRFAQPQK